MIWEKTMKTLILFKTLHGCTLKCAGLLKEKLNGEVELTDLQNAKKIDLESFDALIIGGSIHVGQIQKKVKQFCADHSELLKRKKLGLFVCCMEEGEKADAQFELAFPEELRKHATVGIFGGEFNFERMNFIQKAVIKKIAHIDKSISKLQPDHIEEFVAQFNR
jgi:menaquinone-dependent protoporphyrinogen oxidase